eukprot:203835-Pleurochrysis_carterae.AAC.4
MISPSQISPVSADVAIAMRDDGEFARPSMWRRVESNSFIAMVAVMATVRSDAISWYAAIASNREGSLVCCNEASDGGVDVKAQVAQHSTMQPLTPTAPLTLGVGQDLARRVARAGAMVMAMSIESAAQHGHWMIIMMHNEENPFITRKTPVMGALGPLMRLIAFITIPYHTRKRSYYHTIPYSRMRGRLDDAADAVSGAEAGALRQRGGAAVLGAGHAAGRESIDAEARAESKHRFVRPGISVVCALIQLSPCGYASSPKNDECLRAHRTEELIISAVHFRPPPVRRKSF